MISLLSIRTIVFKCTCYILNCISSKSRNLFSHCIYLTFASWFSKPKIPPSYSISLLPCPDPTDPRTTAPCCLLLDLSRCPWDSQQESCGLGACISMPILPPSFLICCTAPSLTEYILGIWGCPASGRQLPLSAAPLFFPSPCGSQGQRGWLKSPR